MPWMLWAEKVPTGPRVFVTALCYDTAAGNILIFLVHVDTQDTTQHITLQEKTFHPFRGCNQRLLITLQHLHISTYANCTLSTTLSNTLWASCRAEEHKLQWDGVELEVLQQTKRRWCTRVGGCCCIVGGLILQQQTKGQQLQNCHFGFAPPPPEA